MAKVTQTNTAITYTLTLDEDEANALYELLVMANHYEGEGPSLARVFNALNDADVYADGYDSTIQDGHVVVTKDDE